MTILNAETAFPRGRRSREKKEDESSSSAKKRKQQPEKQDDKDFLFGEQKITKPKKKSKKSESSDASINIHRDLPLGGGYVRIGDGKKGKETLIEAISFNKLAKGTKLLGIVREVNENFCLISLPNLLTGYILPKANESTPLSQQLLVGQLLAVHVLKTSSDKVGKGKRQVTRRRIEVSADPTHINASGELSRHEVIRGLITSVEDHGVVINLGDGRKGFCKFSKVQGEYEVDREDFENIVDGDKRFLNEGRIYDFLMEDTTDANSSNILPLYLPSKKTLAKRVTPPLYHPSMQDLLPGSLVNVKLDDVAKNGLLVSFAVFRGAINSSHFGANWIPPNKSGTIDQWKPIFDEATHTLRARIIAVDARTKVIRLSLKPHLLNLCQPMELPATGTVIDNASVIRLDANVGALLSLPPLDAPLPYLKSVQPNLAKNESYVEASRRPAAYVHISKISSSRTDENDFNRDFAPSTKHKLRILSTIHKLDGTATAATAIETVEAHVLQHQDLVPGKIYRGVPVCKQMDGGSVMVDFGLGVRGMIPILHLFDKSNISSDYRMRLRKEKFALGRKIDVRVLTIDAAHKRCFLTAKQSLVKAKDSFDDYSSIEVGQRGTGFVSSIDKRALYVSFFNKVYGKVTARSLAVELGVEDHQSDYNIGDVVNCRALSCRKRAGKNLDTNVDMDAEEAAHDTKNLGFWNLNLSLHVEEEENPDELAVKKAKNMSKKIQLQPGSILEPKSMKIVELISSIDKKRGVGFIPGHAVVRIKSKYIDSISDDALSYVECKIPYDQIIDSYTDQAIETKEDMDAFGEKHFTVGKKLKCKGLILSDPKKSSYEYASAYGKLPIISIRPGLVETAEKQKESEGESGITLIPASDTNLFVGAIIQGYVHEVNPKFGAFIHFLDGVAGLIPKSRFGLLLSKWETVTCKIDGLDVTYNPPKILIRQVFQENVPRTPNRTVERTDINAGDEIREAKVLDVDFYRATVEILDKNIVSEYKIRTRLHVTMAETPIMKKATSRSLPGKEKGEEHIGEGHPFYKWKAGKTLNNLVCVGSFVSQQTIFVELSNRKEVDENKINPILFQSESELKPGTRVTCVIIRFTKHGNIVVQPSPGLDCLVPILEVSEDIEVLNNVRCHFQAGDRIECTVLNKEVFRKKKSCWGPENSMELDDRPFLSLVLAPSSGESSGILLQPTEGQKVVGMICSHLKQFNAPSLMLALRGGHRGRCGITELEEPDEWVNMPLERGGSGYKNGEFVQCMVFRVIPRKPIVDVSLRKSRLEGNLEMEKPPETNKVVNAYVSCTFHDACILKLSHNVEGRVSMKELADEYISDPTALFPVGRLVMGKVKAVKKATKTKDNVFRDVLFNVDIDMRESQLPEGGNNLQFEDIKLEGKYKGIVTRIEENGVYVTIDKSKIEGLVHISECSDSHMKNVKELYDLGDLVKVFVIKKNNDNQKLGFSMKASHFTGDESSDDSSTEDSDSNNDSDVEMKEDESQNKLDSEDDDYVSKLAARVLKTDDEEDSGDDIDSDGDEEMGDSVSDGSDDGNVDSTKKAMDTNVGFNWGATQVEQNKESDEDSEDSSDDDSSGEEEEEVGNKSHSSRKKAAARRLEEQRVSKREKALADGTADENPETPADFERLLASDPNNSEKWIRYMAYYLSLSDMDGCRRVAKRSFDRIDFRQEGEKLNVWTALLTMELKYGVNFDETITEACQQNNPKQVHLRACELLEKEIACSENSEHAVERADKLYTKMCKKFRSKKTVWVAHLSYLLKQNRHQEAHALIKRALISLPSYKHVETMSKLAQLEFEFGSVERGRTVFDGILTKYPKRLDLLFVLVDKEIKAGQTAEARSHLRKTAELPKNKLADKQMKKLFRKWMKLEEEHGSVEQQEAVKDVARAYVERRSE